MNYTTNDEWMNAYIERYYFKSTIYELNRTLSLFMIMNYPVSPEAKQICNDLQSFCSMVYE